MSLVTFIIPVRHPENARDWARLKANLSQTIASISNQSHEDWRAVIVANEGADLPVANDHFRVVRVPFPPNKLHEMGEAEIEKIYEAFREDKGRRVLAGMLSARDSRFFMIVDDDDFVSNRIVEFVSNHSDANGWKLDHGYIYDDGGKFLLAYDNFNGTCGTSLIIRSDLYGLPVRFDDASIDWIKAMLGSHIKAARILSERGTPLETLPFRGAIYRVAHAGSHSKAPTLWKKYVFNRQAIKRPKRLLRSLFKLRLLGQHEKNEFFGV